MSLFEVRILDKWGNIVLKDIVTSSTSSKAKTKFLKGRIKTIKIS